MNRDTQAHGVSVVILHLYLLFCFAKMLTYPTQEVITRAGPNTIFWAAKLRYKSTSNIRSFGGRGLNIFFSLIKAGISVRLSVWLHLYYVKNRSSNRLHPWQVCCCDAVSHFGAIWTRDTFRINKLLIKYRTARAGSGASHAGRAYMHRERTLH